MSKQIKKTNQKVILGLLILGLFAFNSYSYVKFNWSDCAYRGECDDGETTSLIFVPMSMSMHNYIVEGAGYFLDSHSNFQLFLSRVEMSEINGVYYNKLREILYKAIEDMEKAREAYYNLKIKADTTPYKENMIEALRAFDYDGLRETNRLIPYIFEKVKGYLSKGDVRGLYADVLSKTETILEKLYNIKESVDIDQFPEINELWRINQFYSESLFTGQYTSEVFRSILFEQ
jgi:hypothetical protein